MKKVFFGLLVAAVTAAIAVPLAVAGGGNSDAANACKQGGWQNLVRQDGTGFRNQGDCVSYAAQGGVPTAKSTPGAAGNVTWNFQDIVTGSLIFNANQTGGSLDYRNSEGNWLHGVVTSYRQIDAHTAVFAGPITDGSPNYTDYTDPDYFFAKVVDGGASGDQVAVLANAGPTDASGDYDMSQGSGIVTGGNLVVN